MLSSHAPTCFSRYCCAYSIMADVTIEPEVDEQQRNIKSYSAAHQSYGLKQESPCLQISHELGRNSVVCIFMNWAPLSVDL